MKFSRFALLFLCLGLMDVPVFAASRTAVEGVSSEEQQQLDADFALSLSEQGTEQTDNELDAALVSSLDQEGIDWSYLPNTQQPVRRFGQENVMENGLVARGTVFYPRCVSQMGSRCGLHTVLNAHALNQAFAIMIEGQSLNDAGVGEDFITNTNSAVETLLAHQGAELLRVIQHQHHNDINWLLAKLNAGTDLDVEEVEQLCTALQLTNVYILGKNPQFGDARRSDARRFDARQCVQDRTQRGWNQGWLNNESPFVLEHHLHPITIMDFETNVVTYIRGIMARGERGIYHFICHANGGHWILISLIKEINQEPIFIVLDSVQAPLVSKIGAHYLDAVVYLAYIRNLFASTVEQAPVAITTAHVPAKSAASSTGFRGVSSASVARPKAGVWAPVSLSVSSQGASKKGGVPGKLSGVSPVSYPPFSLGALATCLQGKEVVSQVPDKATSAKTGVAMKSGVAKQGVAMMPSLASVAASCQQQVKGAGSHAVTGKRVPQGFLSSLAAGMASNQPASSASVKRTVVPHAPTKTVTPSAAVPAQEEPPKEIEVVDCPICLENLVGASNEVVLRCTHSFHEGCISRWRAEGHSTCPYCRSQIE